MINHRTIKGLYAVKSSDEICCTSETCKLRVRVCTPLKTQSVWFPLSSHGQMYMLWLPTWSSLQACPQNIRHAYPGERDASRMQQTKQWLNLWRVWYYCRYCWESTASKLCWCQAIKVRSRLIPKFVTKIKQISTLP